MKRNHSKTVEEHIEDVRKNLSKKKKITGNRIDLLLGFKPLAQDMEVYMRNNMKNSVFNLPRKGRIKLVDVFFRICDDEFLDQLIEHNVSLTTISELPKLFHNPKNETFRRDLREERRKLVLKFFACRLLIMSNPSPNFSSNFPLSTDGLPDIPLMGRNSFQQMISNFQIRLTFTPKLNNKISSIVSTGRYVVLDEKHKGTNKDHHLARWVFGKDPEWGHWNTELSLLAKTTGLPFVNFVLPLTSEKPNKSLHLPYNNFNLVDIFEVIHNNIVEDTIIITDAYYLDDASRKFLRDKNRYYMCAINPIRFKEVWEEAKKSVKKKGDWVILYNEKTKEHAMMCFDMERDKQFYVLTNSFLNRKAVRKPVINTIWHTYEHLFNSCDRFNHFLHATYWPYRRDGWQSNFDDFYFSLLVRDVYTMWHEIEQLKENIEWYKFCHKLGHDILETLT